MAAPLAERMRPTSLEEVVGQTALLGEGKPLRGIFDAEIIPNLIFYGPPGVGKTTVASLLAKQQQKKLCKLNGTTATTADIRHILDLLDTLEGRNGIVLYLDEIQYLNKKQQQILLETMEDGSITLIAATTENPYFYIYSAILSRATVFEFLPVSAKDLHPAIHRGVAFLSTERGREYTITDEAAQYIATHCGGDVRKALNTVELCVLSLSGRKDDVTISLELAESLSQSSVMRYDRNGDNHYDLLSALQKSLRGSDPDAALHYLGRLLEAGDLPSTCRRLMVCACEDVGLAYPQIIPIVKSAVDIALMVGLPEARIPLADAVVLVATSPKSNSAYMAIDKALGDIRSGLAGEIPRQLQNMHYDGEERAVKGQHYQYPHDFKNHWVPQQYLPDTLRDAKYYEFGDNKAEQAYKAYWQKIRSTD